MYGFFYNFIFVENTQIKKNREKEGSRSLGNN